MSNHAPNTWHGMAKRPAITATKAKRLPAKKRKLLVAEIHNEEQDISAKALEAVWKLRHFAEYPIQDKFRELFLKNSNVSSVGLVKCIEEMQYAYKKLLTKFCVGKKILEMQQAWIMHINFYIEGEEADDVSGLDNSDKKKMHEVWKAVVDQAKQFEISIGVEDQRIIVSSLAFIVFDMMASEVKAIKLNSDQFVESTSTIDERRSMCESRVTVYRYAGAALHSMIEK